MRLHRRLRAHYTLSRTIPRQAIHVLVATAMLAGVAPSLAADEHDAGGWTFDVSPYLWAAGISGRVGTLPGLPATDIDASFGDIWDNLQFAGMLAGSASKGRFSVAGDLQYVETQSKDSSLTPLFGSERLTSKNFIASALAEYLVVDHGRSNLRVSGGLRVWSVDTELELSAGLLPGRKVKGDDTWVDPMLGTSGIVGLGASHAFLIGWGYVGGFGVGSDIMADLFGGIGYRFTDSISTTVGYRWMKVDRDADGFLYDVEQEGMMAGLIFSF